MFLPLRFLSVLLLLLLFSIGYSDNYALVIGNSNYPSPNNLRNPRNDAEDLATALRSIGFNVSAYYDLGEAEMQNHIAEFSRQLSSDDIALFYFAGHGTQFQNKNHLIPIDANFTSPETLLFNTIEVEDIMRLLEASTSRVKIVILDACRTPTYRKASERDFTVEGLARMNAGRGTLIAFATSPGEIAYDGEGRNSPYMEQLKELIINPEMDVEEIFRQTRYNVVKATEEYYRGPQQPEEYNRLSAPVHLFVEQVADEPEYIATYSRRNFESYVNHPVYGDKGKVTGRLHLAYEGQSSYRLYDEGHCTAVIISPQYIITAAHCVYSPQFSQHVGEEIHLVNLALAMGTQDKADMYPIKIEPVELIEELDMAILEFAAASPYDTYGAVNLSNRREAAVGESLFMIHYSRFDPTSQMEAAYLTNDCIRLPDNYSNAANIPILMPDNKNTRALDASHDVLHSCEADIGSAGALVYTHDGKVGGLHFSGHTSFDPKERFWVYTDINVLCQNSPILSELCYSR